MLLEPGIIKQLFKVDFLFLSEIMLRPTALRRDFSVMRTNYLALSSGVAYSQELWLTCRVISGLNFLDQI